jgi:hypothetical protein
MFGIIIADTTFSEKSVMIFEELNKNAKSLKEAPLFYVNLSSQVTHADFSIMNITEITNAYGWTLLATCLMSADILRKATVNAKKAYYIMDLGFIMKPYDFNSVYETLSELRLITRSKHHQKFIKNLFNLDSVILPLDSDKICNTLS